MSQQELHALTGALAHVCAEEPLAEKWLFAPSRRVGLQWLDAVARSGRPVLNVRVTTLPHFAALLADPVLADQRRELLREPRAVLLTQRLLRELRGRKDAYLAAQNPSPGLVRSVHATLRDLRLAGVRSDALRARDFETTTKGRELIRLLSAWEQALDALRLADPAEVLYCAIERVDKEPVLFTDPTRLLLPGSMAADLRGLERRLWQALPEALREELSEDGPPSASDEALNDARRLAWVLDPASAPPPREDGTVSVFRALGERSEIREVLRRVVEAGIPFDQVEIVHTDASAYVPALYAELGRLLDLPVHELPVTFAEGLSARLARPGRALLAWASWIQEDFPQPILTQMLADGLLNVSTESPRSAQLAECLRALPVGLGRDRYLSAIDAALHQAARAQSAPSKRDPDISAPTSGDDAARRRAGLERLHALLAELFECAPRLDSASAAQILRAAETFLQNHARVAERIDAYARDALLEEVQATAQGLEQDPATAAEFDPWAYLTRLGDSVRILGHGPLPGRLHVSSLGVGGHAGRPHVFLVGLDDVRFPGAGLQDPVLLDGERGRLSGELSTAHARLARRTQELGALLARQRGRLTLSYACRDVAEDRDRFPAPPILAAYRILTGAQDATAQDLDQWLGAPVAAAADAPPRTLDAGEWWVARLCAGPLPDRAADAVSAAFAHLGRGFAAQRARESDAFTAYDGFVPQAGQDLDPTLPQGPVLSASRLELLGACPLAYFFRYVLGAAPPEDWQADPAVWLAPEERGELLHRVFREFMAQLQGAGERPDFARDLIRLDAILDRAVRAQRRDHPPASEGVFAREQDELRRMARIFVREEEAMSHEAAPMWFEVSVGLPPEADGTALDTPEPTALTLSPHATIRARARIDRVDRVIADPKTYRLWDYKTGSASRYRPSKPHRRDDPFDQGRVVQNALYFHIAQARLRAAVDPEARVREFGYFFPSVREHGERITWTAQELAAGRETLARLVALLRSGAFPASDDPEEWKATDYETAIGPLDQAADQVRRKLDAEALRPFRELRGHADD